jgi:hypothetical protein
MIGIINADGTMTWVLQGNSGEQSTVRLRVVRHGQKKIHLRFVWQEKQGNTRSIGVMKFKTGIDGFIESPEMETSLRIDAKGRLYVSVDCLGAVVHQRFSLPFRPRPKQPQELKSKADYTPVSKAGLGNLVPWLRAHWAVVTLMMVGTAGFTAGAILLVVAA